ncbi:acyltransferase family protein [Mycobacterium sp. E3305]|uniref:acyltransferase family protein n=1 Tax=Mycobacterium sp. E3305 TaxID=1834145 RepID=UPI0009EE90E3|nr:acyltransferase family protein [Mycobacterium sp. E3305]
MTSRDDTRDPFPPPAAAAQTPVEPAKNAADATGDRRAKKGFRDDIEGLRAVAVLAVVLFHCNLPGLGGGFVGVDVFFVISGFLITGLLWREVDRAGTVRLGRFYGARARRLLPASATVGVVTAIGSALLLPPFEAKSVIGDGIASALYVSNYRFAQQGVDYFQIGNRPASPFQHYWSLGVEEQFYLVWPALIIGTAWLIRRIGRRPRLAAHMSSVIPYVFALAFVGAVSFAFSLAATTATPSVAFFSLHTRAWELAAGGLVALTTAAWRRLAAIPAAIAGWIGLALIMLACSKLNGSTPYPGTAALLPVFGTVLVIGAGCAAPSLGCGRLLALSPMRAVGRVSYSWYLWHWPVLLLATPLLGHPLGPVDGLAALLVSFALAVLTLRLIENPLRYADWVRLSAARSLAVGGAATVLAVCVGLVLQFLVPTPVGRGPAAPTLTVTAGSPPTGSNVDLFDAAVEHTFAQVRAAVAASVDLKSVPSNLDPPLSDAVYGKPATTDLKGCVLNLLEVAQPECATGDTSSATTVALVGDSNAGMWAPAFQEVASQRHWRLEVLSKASCPMLDLPINIFHRKYTECEHWRGDIMARLRNEHPRLIALGMLRVGPEFATGFPAYAQAWIDSLTRLVQELRGIGANVLVLGPIPDLHSMVPDCLSVHLDDAMACSLRRAKAVNEAGIASESAATHAVGGRYADLIDLFCAVDRCPPIVGNTLVYHNEFHVAPQYARVLAPVIGALADRALLPG